MSQLLKVNFARHLAHRFLRWRGDRGRQGLPGRRAQAHHALRHGRLGEALALGGTTALFPHGWKSPVVAGLLAFLPWGCWLYYALLHVGTTQDVNEKTAISKCVRLMYHSNWCALGTSSVRLKGAPWGNVRSLADGIGENSTGAAFWEFCEVRLTRFLEYLFNSILHEYQEFRTSIHRDSCAWNCMETMTFELRSSDVIFADPWSLQCGCACEPACRTSRERSRAAFSWQWLLQWDRRSHLCSWLGEFDATNPSMVPWFQPLEQRDPWFQKWFDIEYDVVCHVPFSCLFGWKSPQKPKSIQVLETFEPRWFLPGLTLSGRLRPLSSAERDEAKRRFATRHPLAKWLAEGGAHTGGTCPEQRTGVVSCMHH